MYSKLTRSIFGSGAMAAAAIICAFSQAMPFSPANDCAAQVSKLPQAGQLSGRNLTATTGSADSKTASSKRSSIASSNYGADHNFATPPGLRGRVDFWILIFTKYGDKHRVFHHREYPEVIYSVLDFSHYESTLTGKKLQRTKERAVERELARIRSVLNYLASGKPPRNPWEKRLEKQFAKIPGSNAATKYRAAAEQGVVRYQRGIKERFYEGLVRSGRYLNAIEDIFRSEGLPTQIGRLPLVESSFNYEAYSSVGAAGIWQFMRSTGRKYMRVTSSIDERRDPMISTRAAAEYLKHAYSRLGNWPLALTSYNHGVAGMMRAVNQTGSRDLAVIIRRYKSPSFGFASGNFYPSFLAALDVDQNAKFYFPDLVREKPWKFDEIRLGRSVLFRDLVKYSRSSEDEIERLNLAFRRPILSNSTRIPAGALVKVPHGHGARVVASISNSKVLPLSGQLAMSASLKDPKRDSKAGTKYKVRRGDTVGAIARRFGISSSELMDYNNLRDARRLRAGATLRIPGTANAATEKSADASRQGSSSRSERAASSSTGSTVRHTVAKGDTVGRIAKQYGVSTRALLSANGIDDPRRLKVGRKIVIPGGTVDRDDYPAAVKKSENADSGNKEHYTIVPGDSLSKIAKKFSLTVSELRRLNPDVKTEIFPGQTLVVK